MKIRMLRSEYGSYDGAHVLLYNKDEEYVVGEGFMPYDLSEVFIEMKAAERIGEKAPGPSEIKEAEPFPGIAKKENKPK